MAFVSAFAPGVAAVSRTAALSPRTARAPARFSMMSKSPSVPFMDMPENINASMPGFVGFGTYLAFFFCGRQSSMCERAAH